MSDDGIMISPQQAHQDGWMIVDVRSTRERRAESVPNSMHLPLEEVESGARVLQAAAGRVALLCKSGVRAQLAQERLAQRGVQARRIEGGLDGWKREGLPVTRGTASRWSLERQVRFGAGLFVLAGTLAVALLSRWWLLFTGLIGCGLIFAGATDICMLGSLLARMSWNRYVQPYDNPKSS